MRACLLVSARKMVSVDLSLKQAVRSRAPFFFIQALGNVSPSFNEPVETLPNVILGGNALAVRLTLPAPAHQSPIRTTSDRRENRTRAPRSTHLYLYGPPVVTKTLEALRVGPVFSDTDCCRRNDLHDAGVLSNTGTSSDPPHGLSDASSPTRAFCFLDAEQIPTTSTTMARIINT